ncbi:hypothetical protein TWF694_010998 [Orbilia ellipsospora]|uniref:Uncharacterized protein n=1 Tax=Orbilia ellipsospora TaxID=2528407 RepID=A0AAV9X930_9PEZI
MLQRILVISSAILLLPGAGATTRATTTSLAGTKTISTTASTVTSFIQSTAPTVSNTPVPDPTDPTGVLTFWKKNWHWFLIGFVCAVVPIIIWAILGPGRRWRKARKHKSRPITWDMIGNERFQNPSMGEVRRFSRSRGSGSSTSSNLALSLNAAAPGEQDIEAAAAIASPKLPSAYIERERMMRSDSTKAVIGLVQPQGLVPPRTHPADRTSTGSFGPPDPALHRAHPRYNYFQRYSRQHMKRQSRPLPQQQNNEPASSSNAVLQESMQLLLTQIPHRKPLPDTRASTNPRESIPTTATQQLFLPQPPKSTPYHIRQNSLESGHSRSTSWHHTTHRGSVEAGLYTSRHVSMDGYDRISRMTPLATTTAPRRSTSRGRLQKPQHLNPRNHNSIQPKPQEVSRDEPQMSFYRTPQPSRESLTRTLVPPPSTSSVPPVPPMPQPVYQKPAYRPSYPIRSAMSKGTTTAKEDRIYGTETGYSFSISGGPATAKSVKFAALPSASASVPGRFPVRHF